MIKTLKENSFLYLTWLIIIVCISVSVFTTNLLCISALCIFAAFVVFKPINESIVLLFGIMPFANIFKMSAGSTSFFTLCELMVVFVSLFKCRKLKGGFLVFFFLFLSYILATSVDNFNVLGIIKVIMGIYIIYLTTSNVQKKDVINIAYLISASTTLMLLLSMNSSYFRYIESYLFDLNYLIDSSTGWESETMRLSGFLGDPNYCGVLIVMTVALLCVLYYYKMIKTEFWLFTALLIPLGFFTYSKSYFLCISALVLFLIIFVLFPKYKGWALASVVVVAVVVYMAVSGKIDVFNKILLRFSSGDVMTGRSVLNDLYLNYIWNNPSVLFFGEGINADRFIGANNNVHNIYIEGLFKLGIIGCALYVMTIFIGAKAQKNTGKQRKVVNYIPVIFLMILYYALAGITMYEFPFYITIALLAKDFNLLNEDTTLIKLNKEMK